MTIQQAEIGKNIEEIQSNAVELHQWFLIFIEKFNSIGVNLSRLNKCFNEAVGSAQSRMLPQDRVLTRSLGRTVRRTSAMLLMMRCERFRRGKGEP